MTNMRTFNLATRTRWILHPRWVVILVLPFSGMVQSSSALQATAFPPISEISANAGGHSLSSDGVSVPQGVLIEDGISEEEAIALALWNNAAFLDTLSDLGFARADLVKSGILSNPVFSFLLPRGPRHFEASLYFPLDPIMLKPSRVAIAQIRSRGVGQRLMQNGLDLVRDVKIGWVDLDLARNLLALAKEASALRTRIAEISVKRSQSGDVSEFEVTTAHIQSLLSTGDEAVFDKDVAIAKERLKSLIGLGMTDYEVSFDTLATQSLINNNEKDLIEAAFAARPDMRAAELTLQAAGRQINLAPREALKLEAYVDGDKFNSALSDDFEIGFGLKIGLPILDRNQAGIARAQAEFKQALTQHNKLRDQIALEVKESLIKYNQATSNLELLRQHVQPLMEGSITRVERAYEGGNISFTVVLETTRQALDIRSRQAKAMADQKRAKADLERSIGLRLKYETRTLGIQESYR